MNVNEAVKDMANYGRIVSYFRNLEVLGLSDLVQLVDVIEAMSEQIFEHYQSLCHLCRDELKRLNRIYQERYSLDFLDESQKLKLQYILDKAIRMKIVLAEKYQELANACVYPGKEF